MITAATAGSARWVPVRLSVRRTFGSWVVGAFGDYSFSSIQGQSTIFCPGGCAGREFSGQFKHDWSWAVGGRVGLVALPGLLTYVNGGYTRAHFTGTTYFNSGTGAATGLVLGDHTRDVVVRRRRHRICHHPLPGLFMKTEYRFLLDNKTLAQGCRRNVMRRGWTIRSLDRGTSQHSSPRWSTASTGVARSSRSTDLC